MLSFQCQEAVGAIKGHRGPTALGFLFTDWDSAIRAGKKSSPLWSRWPPTPPNVKNFRIFIGYDPREKVAFHVLSYSIIKYSSIPVNITPVNLFNLRNFYRRKKGPKDSTEFSISRFLTPYLSDFKGYSLFLDCDFVFNGDVADLLKIINKDKRKKIWQV